MAAQPQVIPIFCVNPPSAANRASKLRFRWLASVLFCVAAAGGGGCVFAQNTATLTVDLQHAKGKVSPSLYGLMTEEINYSYEGGLYAQLIRTPEIVAGWDQPAHWFTMPHGNAQLSVQLDKSVYRLPERKVSMRVDIKQADGENFAAIGNEGYWGIPVRPSETYNANIYAKGQGAGAMTASIVSNDTGRILATATVRR